MTNENTEQKDEKPAEPAEPMTQEEMDQLNADPSLLIDHPELEAKLDATLAAEAAASAGAAAPVTPETPAAAASPPPEGQTVAEPKAAAEAKPTFEVPSWFKQVPEADRPAVLESMIKALPKAERAKLAPIAEMLREVDSAAEQRGASAAVQQQEAAQRVTSIDEAAAAFKDNVFTRIQKGEQVDLDAEVGKLTGAGAASKQSEMASGIRDAINLTLQSMRVAEIPAEVLAQAGKAPDLSTALNHYMVFIANSGFNQGVAYAQGQSVKDVKAAEVVDKARMRDEIMADLAKEGLLKNQTAPNITAQGGSGAASELTDDDIRRYEQLVADNPLAVPADLEEKVERSFAASLASR